MRMIERSTQFKKDYKRESKGNYSRVLDQILVPVLETLTLDVELDFSYRDHDLIGNWIDHRECHLKPDLLLIYQKPNAEILRLARLGSHSNLFH